MGKETKSNGQKDLLDRFYTQSETVTKCLQLIDFPNYDCIIEPSAGTGNFLDQFPAGIDIFAYDVIPEDLRVIEADWFKIDKTIFNNYTSVLICGNPPFGQQNSLAIKFFNESAKIANTIAFILPLSFKKASVQNRLDLNFWLKDEIILGNCNFLLKNKDIITVPCVFQVWEKRDKKRELTKLKTTTNLFSFVDKNQADFRVQRVGGNAGKASFDLTKSASSNYFIKNNSKLTNEEFVDFINQLHFPTIEFTVGPKSLSKTELIAIVEENFN